MCSDEEICYIAPMEYNIIKQAGNNYRFKNCLKKGLEFNKINLETSITFVYSIYEDLS